MTRSASVVRLVWAAALTALLALACALPARAAPYVYVGSPSTGVFQYGVGGDGLRRVEFTILALVKDNPGVTARQLARALAVTPPNIAIWLDRLESRDLVARVRSTADGRLQHIESTRAGSVLVDRSVRALLEGEAAALSTLSAAERAMLVELLHKVALARKRSDGSA